MPIREVAGEPDLALLRILFREYGAHLAAGPSGAAHICIADFDREIDALPARYEALFLAEHAGLPAGCVALTKAKLPAAIEMKRLWVRPAAQGQGIGRALVLAAMDWAQAHHYAWIYLDTAPAAMPAAQALYRSLGFEEIERYNDNPVPGISFFRRRLAGDQPILS